MLHVVLFAGGGSAASVAAGYFLAKVSRSVRVKANVLMRFEIRWTRKTEMHVIFIRRE
jgi:hypothetical protein